MRVLALALVIFMAIGVNLPHGMIARLGFEPSYMLAALVAVVMAWLMAHAHALLILLVVVLSFGANLPDEYAQRWNIETDYMLAALVAVVLLPLIERMIGWDE